MISLIQDSPCLNTASILAYSSPVFSFSFFANISSVYKGNERELVVNYRSISLLSIPGKCQEHIVYTAINQSHVSAYLTDWQHSFVKGRSTVTQLILTHHKWAKALDEGRSLILEFLCVC